MLGRPYDCAIMTPAEGGFDPPLCSAAMCSTSRDLLRRAFNVDSIEVIVSIIFESSDVKLKCTYLLIIRGVFSLSSFHQI